MLKDSDTPRYAVRRTKRTYSAQTKAELLAACSAPGASIAAVASAHGMNANVLHRWLKESSPSRSSIGGGADTCVTATDIADRHEPDSTTCTCGCQLKRIGEDVSEKLDYTPGLFTVERHVRGKWVCGSCETLAQAPGPPQVIDKGIPTAGLLAQAPRKCRIGT